MIEFKLNIHCLELFYIIMKFHQIIYEIQSFRKFEFGFTDKCAEFKPNIQNFMKFELISERNSQSWREYKYQEKPARGELQQQMDFSLLIRFPILSSSNLNPHSSETTQTELWEVHASLFIDAGNAWIQKCGWGPGSSVMRCTAISHSVHEISTRKINSKVWVRTWILCVVVHCDSLQCP